MFREGNKMDGEECLMYGVMYYCYINLVFLFFIFSRVFESYIKSSFLYDVDIISFFKIKKFFILVFC